MTYTVYLAGTATPAATSGVTAAITSTVAAGDTVIVCACTGGSPTENVWEISDTQGDVYNVVQQSISEQGMYAFTCQDANALTTSDSVTVAWNSAAAVKNLAVIGVHGAATTTTLVTKAAQASGSSASPSVTTAALGSSSELAVALFSNGSGGGAPSLPGGWTQIAQVHTSGQAYLTVAYQALAASSAVTASATITSTRGPRRSSPSPHSPPSPAGGSSRLPGHPGANQFQVVTKTAGATSVRLQVATNAGMSAGVVTYDRANPGRLRLHPAPGDPGTPEPSTTTRSLNSRTGVENPAGAGGEVQDTPRGRGARVVQGGPGVLRRPAGIRHQRHR